MTALRGVVAVAVAVMTVASLAAGSGCERADSRAPTPTPSPTPVELSPGMAPRTCAAQVVLSPSGVEVDGAAVASVQLTARLGGCETPLAVSVTGAVGALALVDVLRAGFAAGRPTIALSVDGVLVVTEAPASDDATAMELVLDHDRVDVGYEHAIDVFSHPTSEPELASRIRSDLDTPFFHRATALALDVRDGDAHVLAAMLAEAASRTTALRIEPAPPPAAPSARVPASVSTLPMCRKLAVRAPAGVDPAAIEAAMPSLYAMDLCYREFEPLPGDVGRVAFRFAISKTGSVADAHVSGMSSDVERCMEWLVSHAQFPTGTRERDVTATAECNTRCCNGD